MATTLGTLLIELKAKTDQFEKGMKNAKDLTFTSAAAITSSLSKIGSQFANMRFNGIDQAGKSVAMLGGIAAGTGAALASSLVAVAIETSTKMIEMSHNAERAGMDIKEFSENAYAAKRSGVAIEDFTNSMSKLAKTAVSAAQGNAQAQRALALAGTSATDSAGRLRSTGSILDDVIKKYDSLSDKTLKVGLSQQVFGRGGAALLPFLEKGGDAIRKYREQAELLGIALDEKTVAAAKNFKGAINDYKAASEGATIQMTAGMLPALNGVLSAMTKVEGHSSAMRSFGESVGSVFKGLAIGVLTITTGIEELGLRIADLADLGKAAASFNPFNIGEGVAALSAYAARREERKKAYDELEKGFYSRVGAITAGTTPSAPKTEKPVGTKIAGPDSTNYAAEEIAKLKEKAQATSALAAAQLISEQSVRATTAANQADSVILQIATKAAKEHKTALLDEIAAAEKRYGAQVRGLTAIADDASRNETFNKSIAEQIRDATISAEAHDRLSAAIAQGGESVQSATVFNEIDQMVRKADIVLSKEQMDALQKLRDAKQRDAEASANESITKRTTELQSAARATQLLTSVIGKGSDAEIEARAQIEAENFAIQNNISLTDTRIKKLQEQIAANERASHAQQTGQGMVAEYDPRAAYNQRISDIDAAVRQNKDLTVYAEAAKRDAYLQEQEALDQVAMKTQKGAAGAKVALREWLRDAQDWAKTMHEATGMVLQGFDTGFREAFSGILMGTKTVGQAFAEMGRTMVQSVVDALALIVAKWIETAAILAVMKLFGINLQAEDPMAKAQKQIAANAATAQSYAGLSAAEEFAFALAESMGDIPYALGMSLVALGIGEGFTAMAAFDNGGIMPKTGVALVHQDEGVLTAPVTKMLKNMATSPKFNSASTPRGSQSSYGGDTHLTYAPVINALDSHGVKAVLDEHSEYIQGIVRSGNRNRGWESLNV
jgi:hypothetical protein